jgi:pyruvate dehydrogenase E2 component (dihydrolipoamide acetyltransferase)
MIVLSQEEDTHMPLEITMPKLSDTMTDGTLVKWLKKENDAVKPGDIIAEVETDKATQELEAFEPGTIAKIVAAEGQKVAVGGLIVVLAKPGEKVADVAKAVTGAPSTKAANKEASAKKEEAPKTAAIAVAESPAPTGAAASPAPAHGQNGAPIRVSPLARRIAAEKGVDLAGIIGSGPDGRIIKRDILTVPVTPAATKAASAPAPAPAPVAVLEAKTIPLSNMRQTIARRLLEAKQSIPHFYVSVDVLMDNLLELRKSANEQLAPTKLTVTDFITRAVAVAVTQVPAINASFGGDKIVRHGSVHVGIAVAIEDGLVVPVLRDAQIKNLRQISGEIKQLAELARNRKLKADQMTGSTITISNLGMYGIKEFTAIINPPEAAILAIGGTEARPVVKNGALAVGQVMTVTLSADHRVVDGATGAEFLSKLKAILENPMMMLI